MDRLPRVLVALCTCLFLTAAGADTAFALVTPGQAAEEARRMGWAIEQQAEPVDQRALRDVLARLEADGVLLWPVFLADDPPQGALGFADEVLDRLSEGTVVVLSPSDVAASSLPYGDGAVDAALQAAADDFGRGGDPVAGLERFGRTLAAGGRVGPLPTGPITETRPREPAGSRGGGGGIPGVLLLGMLLLGGFFVFNFWQVRRRQRTWGEQALTEGRAELRAQVAAMADDILELGDAVTLTGDREAQEAFAEASATYSGALGALESATAAHELAGLSDKLDRARWQMAVARAAVEGRPAPPGPTAEVAAGCFFDPTHGAGVAEATLRTSAGDKGVRVCTYCSQKLSRGQIPEPRMIPVEGTPVPAPMAPPSHGGGGMDWLDVFSVLVGGGLGRGRDPSTDWGSYRRRGRRGRGRSWGGGSSSGRGRSGGGWTGGGGRGSISRSGFRSSGGGSRGRSRISRGFSSRRSGSSRSGGSRASRGRGSIRRR